MYILVFLLLFTIQKRFENIFMCDVYIYIYNRKSAHVCACIYMYIYTRVCIYVYACLYVCTCVYIYVYVYI